MPWDKAEEFCNIVRGQMRTGWGWKNIQQELMDHMEDHMLELMEQGVPQEQAQQMAVEAMGDPVEVGRMLDKTHSPWWLGLYQISHVALVLCLILPFGSIWTLGGNILGLVLPEKDVLMPTQLGYRTQLEQQQRAGEVTITVTEVGVDEENQNIYVAYQVAYDSLEGRLYGDGALLQPQGAEENDYENVMVERDLGAISMRGIWHREDLNDLSHIQLVYHWYGKDVVFTIPTKEGGA